MESFPILIMCLVPRSSQLKSYCEDNTELSAERWPGAQTPVLESVVGVEDRRWCMGKPCFLAEVSADWPALPAG